jgi:hypothetical protein
MVEEGPDATPQLPEPAYVGIPAYSPFQGEIAAIDRSRIDGAVEDRRSPVGVRRNIAFVLEQRAHAALESPSRRSGPEIMRRLADSVNAGEEAA